MGNKLDMKNRRHSDVVMRFAVRNYSCYSCSTQFTQSETALGFPRSTQINILQLSLIRAHRSFQ